MTRTKHFRMIALVFTAVLTLVLGGCASYTFERREVDVDPTYRRVMIFNDTSRFILMDSGVFNQSFDPGESLKGNVGCFGNVEGLVDAYAIVGKFKNGSPALEWYGQRKYRLHVDAKNEAVRGESVDAYRVFTDNDFYPNGRKEIWTLSHPCGGIRMSIRFGG